MSAPRRLGLADWLRRLPDAAPAHLLVGCAGHLLLNATERTNTRKHLDQNVFPMLFRDLRQVTLVCGMAPGADLLFLRSASQWLAQAGIETTRIALLPLPLDVLIEDWADKAAAESVHLDRSRRSQIHETLQTLHDEADGVVELPVPAGAIAAGATAFRQGQYRQLAAVLAEQTDVLVALLRDQQLQRPGGTAEVVEWRRHPRQIPPALSTLGLRRPRGMHRLWVIDPSQPAGDDALLRTDDRRSFQLDLPAVPATVGDADSVADDGRRALRSGNYLRCYDLVRQAQERGQRSRELDYLSLLALANAGSTALALERYQALRLSDADLDEDWLALEGRLLKDRAAGATGAAAQAWYWASAQAYLRAFRRTGGSFTGINAATQFLLADQPGAALTLAGEVLQQLAGRMPEDETRAYYLRATEAEAALLLGDEPRCREALREADTRLRGNLNVRSRSLAQLRLICRKQGRDTRLLEILQLAPVLYLPLQMLPAVPEVLPSFVFAGMTHPQDLAAVENALLFDAPLHLVLPSPGPALVERWHVQYGEDAARRLFACLDRAQEISVARGFLDDEDRWCAQYVAAMACGLSKLMSRQLGCGWTAAGSNEDFGDGSHLCRWLATPEAGDGLYTRQQVGTLFADFVGFSRLADTALPAFWRYFTAIVSEIHQRHGEHILYHRTWGDALHIVAVDAAAIADIAADLRDSLERLRPTLEPALARLEWRLAAHYAPVFRDTDATGAPIFFGSPLSFAARVEPITPPGMIFVTEAFAARLALEAPLRYAAEYVGELDLPKGYGKYRLFNLRSVSPVTP